MNNSPVGESLTVLDTSSAAIRLLPDPHGSDPIRAEVFGLEHLEAHARQLADSTSQITLTSGRPLLQRFKQNALGLSQAHRLISEAYRRQERFGADAEWILDNFHIITDALAEIRTDLPRGYYHA